MLCPPRLLRAVATHPLSSRIWTARRAFFTNDTSTILLDHFVSHPAKEEGIGLGDVLGRVTMQFFVSGTLQVMRIL
jgi:hypothetical protein